MFNKTKKKKLISYQEDKEKKKSIKIKKFHLIFNFHVLNIVN